MPDSNLIAGLVGALIGSGATWLLTSLDRQAETRGALRALYVEVDWNIRSLEQSGDSPPYFVAAETWRATLIYAGRGLRGRHIEVAAFYRFIGSIIEVQSLDVADADPSGYLSLLRSDALRIGPPVRNALRRRGWHWWERPKLESA